MTMQDEKEYVFVLKQKRSDVQACHVAEEIIKSAGEATSTATSPCESATFGDSDDSVELEESVELDSMPVALPFLPAMDASTQITVYDGYSEAIMDAQHALDSRLLAYSQYQQMVSR